MSVRGHVSEDSCMVSSYHTIKTADGVDVEITMGDVNCEPGLKGGVFLNQTVVWFRPDGGQWMRSRHRSAIGTADLISRTNLANLRSVSDITDTQAEKHDEQEVPKEGCGTALTRTGLRK